MAENPFLTSPFAASDFVDTPEQATKPSLKAPTDLKQPAARGVAPTRDDIVRRAQQLDIDPALALSFFSQESSGNWNSKDSPRGARGGMQVMPGTYRSMMGTDAGQNDPWNNLEAGLRYISYGQKRLNTKDPVLLAAGYHAGYDRKDLKVGIIPNTNDGAISTADYARSVAGRMRGTRFPNSAKPASVDDQFSDTPEGAVSPAASDFVDSPEEAKSFGSTSIGEDDFDKRMAEQQKAIDDQPYWDFFKSKGVHGLEGMQQSLDVARWAVGGVDDTTMAEQLAKKMQADAKIKKSTDEKENDAAWKRVSKAEGFIDTTKEAFKAIGTSLSNPKATLGEIVEQGANSLPSMAAGIGGAGTGAAVGGGVGAAAAGIGAVPGAITGAILGGRAGMAAGTVAVEGAGQIQELIGKTLDQNKQPPTAQNILALLESPEFKAEARKQALAKGLTVAAVDQFTMGLGGKIATAPARKIATKEFADAGIDMSTRAARKEALNTAAGRAAVEAAKPTVGARVGAGAAAVGLDVTGEVVGDYAGSVAASGKGDIGESLRGGLMSVGQSGVSVAVGSTIETAKMAARAAKSAMQSAPSPSTASGPLARATENAAVTPERVTVTAPDGRVSGTVTGQSADAVQIVGDDGEVFSFKTGPDGVTITPEAPNTPLTNALEVAANTKDGSNAENSSDMPGEPLPQENGDQVVSRQKAPQNGSGSVSDQALPPQPQSSPEAGSSVENANPGQKSNAVEANTTGSDVHLKTEAPAAPVLADMDEPALRERLKYIADQAKTNGGWNKMLVEQRRQIEKEINARAPKVETPKVEQPSLDLKPAEPAVKVEPVDQATPAQKAAAALPKATLTPETSRKLQEAHKALGYAVNRDQVQKMHDRVAKEVETGKTNNGGVVVNLTPKAIKDRQAKLERLKHDLSLFDGVTVEKTPAPAAAPVSQPATSVAVTEEGAGGSQPSQAAPVKLTKMTKADEEHLFGTDKKRAAAMDRIAKGTAYFGTPEKAKEFITKNGLKDTHTVEQTGKVRFEVKAKDAKTTDEQAKRQADYIFSGKAAEDIKSKAKTDGNAFSRFKEAGKEQRFQDLLARRAKDKSNLTEAETNEFYDLRTERNAVTAGDKNKRTEEAMSRLSNKEARNVTDDRTSGQPASAETVVQKADAGQAEAAAVQPSATEEVSADLQSSMEASGWAAEVAGPDNTIWTKRVGKDRYTAMLTPDTKNMEVTVLVDGVDTQIASFKADAPAKAASKADAAVKDDIAATYGTKPEPLTPMAQGAEAAKSGTGRTPPAGLTDKAAFEWMQGYDSQAGTTPAAQQPKTDTSAFANNKIFTADAVEKARARLKSKLGNLNSGIDPEVVMDGMTLAGAYIEAGTRSFAAYAKAMADDFGPKIKPYLLSFYEAARNYPGLDAEGMTPVAEAKAEFDALIKGADLAEVKDAIGETVAKPAKRTKKTGSSSDATLTQDFGVEHIDGYGDGTRETGNATKDAFLKDARSYLKAVADVLTQRGFMVHTDRKGKAMSPVSVNESGMAGSGDVSLALRLPDVGSGIYVHIGDTALRGMVPMTPSGIAVMFRATTEKDPYGGKQNRWAPTDLSAADFADMLEKEARQNAKERTNEPQQLDQPGSPELAGKQPDAVQGSEPQRQAGDGAQGSGGTDLLGGERAGSGGAQPAGRLGNDAGEVPSLAAQRNAGRGGRPGSEPVQRGERAAKPDPASAKRDTGNQPELIPETGTRAQDRADGFVITDEDAIGEGGQKTKFKQNVAAIRLLKQLTAENRQATRAEQAVLAKYVGWGGIPQAFERDGGAVSKGWEKEAAELKEAMTPDELAAAAASTRNAHYTSTEIVSAVWDAVKHFGFQGGRVLEPSVGVGNFFGLMPTALRSASQLTGVELDHITGGIAKQLYPQANIAAPVGFQGFSARDNYFDLAIGNPPFGREGIYDALRRKISGFSIHNYFFAKSIDTVRPNGVLAMVVTNRLLDSTGDKARAYIADRAEFLGAIRLPNDAFAKNAGTQVTTDIIFLRKLKDGEQPTGQSWMDVRQYKDKNGNSVPLNEYFIRNPEMMLGDFGQYGSMYRAEDAALVARPGQDTPALLQAAVAKLPKGFMDGPTAEPVRETIEPMHDISRVKVGSVFEQDGKVFERREDMLGKQQAKEVTFPSDKAKERVTGMIQVRDALIEVRGLQLTEGVDEKALDAARATLNKTYDAFVKANGPLNADANKRLMRDDPTWPQIAALEEKFDKGVTAAVAKTTGEKARAPSAEKSAIFSKRTQAPYKAPEKASSAKDAMVSSLAERGRVDLDYMASLYGKTPEAIAQELEGLIFKNQVGGWESRDQYLSGNVKKKLAQAIDAAKADPSLKANVDALKAVQPADIEAVDIDVKAGAHWVPADVMQGFITHISEGQNAKAVYNPVAASWTLNVERVPQSAMTQWSTDRANILAVLEAAANGKQITIYDKHYDGTRTLNEAATTSANEKVERVKAEWKIWIWADDARRTRLARIYNDTFNTDQQREFDGSHLTFPGKVGDDIIQLRPHQANAVWRMVQSGTTLLDHVVGAGKTFTMIAGIMEMRRMGLAKKPMLVVPNHLVGQWAEDFMKLYPGANILAATKKDFEKDSRKRLFARIATGDWDAVIVAHSSFGKVEVEPEFQAEFIKQQIADMDTSIQAMREAEGKGSRNVKQIEKQKATLEEKLKKLFDTGSKDDNLHFGELGVDAVLLDEAHEFKNLGFSTSMQRVAGLGNPAGSNKAADMFMKVQATLQRTGGKNVVFATGTPISNTMAEMYTMQRFLDYGTLKDQGIAHFDAWAKTFGEVVTDWELSPSGQYKMNSRFAKFVNMPELMQRYGSFADVINRDDINRQLAEQGKKLPVPKVKGGKPENTVVERSRDQAQYIGIPTVDENGVETYPQGSLVWRAENLPKKAEKGADNMLKIMSDARKAALDMRLIDPGYPDNAGSKVNVAADNIKATYDQWDADKGTQLVFCDLSTPKGAVAKEAAALRELVKLAEDGDEAAQSKLDAMSPDELLALDSQFSVYDDLKAKLIAKGIPEKEIAFIHDAGTDLQKAELFAKVRTGRVRVLIGSTSKMGAGMNVQDRLVALHHLDAPWRPSDLEQREGRIIRQGNRLYEANPEGFEVAIKRYATKQTLDSRMWQTIEAKARFIEQVRKGTGEREVEDVAGEAANSAEMKAASSGNPLILEEMSLRQSIRKLENQQAEHNREQFRIKDRMRSLADGAKHFDKQAVELNADAPLAPKEFALKIGKQTFDKVGEAGDAILAAVNAMHAAQEDSREIGSYGGFKLTIDDTSSGLDLRAVVTLQGKGEYQVEANPGSSGVGLGQRIANTVRNLKAEAERVTANAERNRADIPKLEQQIKPWGQGDELEQAKARHAAIIEQLKPKKKPEAAKPEGDVRMSRADDLESVFAALDSRGLARKRALDGLANLPEGEKIQYIESNFWDILAELEETNKVNIKC